jgi:hypothetical protein
MHDFCYADVCLRIACVLSSSHICIHNELTLISAGESYYPFICPLYELARHSVLRVYTPHISVALALAGMFCDRREFNRHTWSVSVSSSTTGCDEHRQLWMILKRTSPNPYVGLGVMYEVVGVHLLAYVSTSSRRVGLASVR